jgi:hypothetical protein
MASEYKTALMNLLRKHTTDPANRTKTSATETFTTNGTTNYVTLANNSLIYINTVTKNGVTQQLNRDFTIYFGKARGTDLPRIIFTTTPANGETVIVNYYYGTNWIFGGYPQTTAEMPRIGLMTRHGNTEPAGFGDVEHFQYPITNVIIAIRNGIEYTINGKIYSGEKLLDYLVDELNEAVRQIRSNSEMGYLITLKYAGDENISFDEDKDLSGKICTLTAQYQWNYP